MRNMPEVDALFAGLGTSEFSAAEDALVARGAEGAEALLHALARGSALGPEGANGRAVMEDLEACLIRLGRAHPEALLGAAERDAVLTTMFAFVSALTRVPTSADLLLELLDARDGSIRWLALEELLRRRDPRAIARLGKTLRDRDSIVRFTAVTAMRRWGSPADLPKLEEIARATRTAPGTREAAYDAIEAIRSRSGAVLSEGAPPPRLVSVVLPPAAVVGVSLAQLVKMGSELARTGADTVRAPCDGVVVDVDTDAIVLRRDRT